MREGGIGQRCSYLKEEPDPPVVVPVQVSGQRVRFSIPVAGHLLEFDGTVKGGELTGVLGTEQVVLKRGKSYWR